MQAPRRPPRWRSYWRRRAHGYVEVAPFNDEQYAHQWFERRL
jgi:hypothetical protein